MDSDDEDEDFERIGDNDRFEMSSGDDTEVLPLKDAKI